MNNLVSVIIPTHNRSQLVHRAVCSVLSQTYSNLECIVVDDASTDDTQQIIQEFTDPRLIYIRHDVNKHASASRNTGIQNAKGEFIAFLDDDDAWLPDKLEKQVKCLSNTSPQVGLVYCWFDTYRDQEVVGTRRPNLRGYIFDQLLVSQPLGNASTLLVRREVINQIGGFDENLPRGNDGDFIRRVGQYYEIEVVPEVLVHYFVDHDGHPRITSNDRKGIQAAIIGHKTKLEKFREELPKYPKQEANILAIISHLYSKEKKWLMSFYYWYKAFLKSPQSTYVKLYGKKSLKLYLKKMIKFKKELN